MSFTSIDLAFIRRAIAISAASLQEGDAPFGALVTKGEEIIAESKNGYQNRISDHAEVLALHAAHQHLGTSDLTGCTLYTSCEPCPMCSFMIREYKISRVVFALYSPVMGGYSKWKILEDNELTRYRPFFGDPPEIIPGLLEEEARVVMNNSPLAGYF